jgi:hypothetical protein
MKRGFSQGPLRDIERAAINRRAAIFQNTDYLTFRAPRLEYASR